MVTTEQYADAVAKLVNVARQGTGGGLVAAQVLLSAYNGFDYQLDISSLGNLDRDNFESAMVIIRGRYETGKEPHTLVANGDRIFGALWNQWFRLHVKERGKVDCPRCDGRGRTYANDNDEDGTPCALCEGKGRVCRCRV